MHTPPPDDLDLPPLRLLVTIARLGTVTEAARHLSLSQPAATHQLRRLERQLGVALVERRGRGVALTAAGEATVARAARALAELAALHDDLRALEGLEAGEVRVGGGTTAAIHVLPQAMAAFKRRWPGVALRLREGGTAEVLAGVAAGELDVGVVGLPASHAGVAVEPWLADPIVFVGWPGAPLAGKPIAPAALDGAPFILAAAGSPIRATVDAALAAEGVAPRGVMALESVAAILACVAAGLGYAAVSARAAGPGLADGRLVALRPRGLALTRRFGLATREGGPSAAAARAFLAALRELGAGPGMK